MHDTMFPLALKTLSNGGELVAGLHKHFLASFAGGVKLPIGADFGTNFSVIFSNILLSSSVHNHQHLKY